MKIKILQWLLCPIFLPADILYLCSKNRKLIQMDMECLIEEIPYEKAGLLALNYLLAINKPFRNIFYYRLQHSLFLRNISRIFLRPLATIEIMGEIDGGFRISHNYAVIHPEKAGRNFFVGHGATIGKGTCREGSSCYTYPVIGNNVSIFANAVVFGNIVIGDNVKIGAGAVVNRDVPDGCTVVGNPCRIIQNEKR